MWTQKGNSLSQVYATKTKRDKLIAQVDRNLRKIGHNYDIADPLGDLLKKLSDSMGKQYSWLEDLDDVTLEGLANNTREYIHELCQQIKAKTTEILETTKK